MRNGCVLPDRVKRRKSQDDCEFPPLGKGTLSARLRSGADSCGLGRGDALVFAVGLLLTGLAGGAAFANVDAAFEEGAVFDGDAGCHDVAGERAVAADIHAIAGGEIAAHFAEYDDFAGVDVGCDYAVAADGDAIAGEIDGAFDPSVNVEGLGAGDLTLDDQRLADGSLVRGGGCSKGARGSSGRLAGRHCRRRG